MSRLPDPHPAVRLLALIVLGVCLFRFSLPALAAAFGLRPAATPLSGGRDALRALRTALRRIRWLLLSSVIIYLWDAPEPTGGGWARPSAADIALALRRAGVLIVLVAAVELLRQTTPVPRTAAAIVQVLSPLAWAGVDTARFASRVALTLEAVPATAETVTRAAGGVTIKQRQLRGWAEAAAALIRDIEERAPREADPAALPALGAPAVVDWLLLAAVAAILVALSQWPA